MYYELKDYLDVRSPLEDIFLKDCITVGLRVEPQYRIGRYQIDFAIPEKKIAIEIDGRDSHMGQIHEAHDWKRDCKIFNLGWNTIRVAGSYAYRRGEEIVGLIKTYIETDEFKQTRKETVRYYYDEWTLPEE